MFVEEECNRRDYFRPLPGDLCIGLHFTDRYRESIGSIDDDRRRDTTTDFSPCNGTYGYTDHRADHETDNPETGADALRSMQLLG
jgi:hypothetical protein